MRHSARAIIIHNDHILVNERNRHGDHYYAIPGGGIESVETAEQAASREVWEETSIRCSIERHVITTTGKFGHEEYFLAKYQSGEPGIQPDAPEFADNQKGENTYQPMWLSLGDLARSRLLPDPVKQRILASLHDGWPDEPVELIY